ncbi:MAG: glycoside hydrolase family 3 C-terminal domain-containing protein [Polyangiales bacterium]
MSYRSLLFRVSVVWLVLAVATLVRADNLAGSVIPSEKSRVDALIARMTLDEKLAMIEGDDEADTPDRQYQAGYLPGVPRLGIPALRLSDGPPGVATRQPSTGMTCTMGLAATFSVEDARANGVVIGRDARALGQDVVLEPYINLNRDTAWGRGFNTLGEDPWLTASIGAEQIRGIQSQGVMAQAKHFLGFDGGNNVVIDEQTLHEVYLLPFALAVEAGVASIMCSYNVINGAHACGSSSLLTQILRNELGFRGFVTSDWGANHATTYLNAGLDLEMPGGAPAAGLDMPSYFARSEVQRGLESGSLQATRIDEAVARILGQYERFGLLSEAPSHALGTEDRAENARVVLDTARHAATLLKNEQQALPLSAAALSSLVLIGPGAAQTIATNGGGEKSGGILSRQIGAFQVLREQLRGAPGAHVTYTPGDDLTGTPVPASQLSHDGRPGLERTDRSTGHKTRDPELAFAAGSGNTLPAGANVTWTGTLTAPESGLYWLHMQSLGATAKLIVDDKPLVVVGSGLTEQPRYGEVHASDGNSPVPTPDGLANSRIPLRLTRGPHQLQVIETADISRAPVQVRLSWVTPSQRAKSRAAAVAAARGASTPIVFVWSGADLSLQLPEEQDQLVAAIAAANPNTIVVLNTSQPVSMPWLDKVKAVLQMWYPGDEGGWATADVLTGKASPSGHLPFTWPQAIEQTAPHQKDHPERSSQGVGGYGTCTTFGGSTGHNCGLTHYTEGVNVGYRWFDATGQTPLYPFGYGLTYTDFDYANLRVNRESNDSLTVHFRVHNHGERAGDAVPQVYLGAPEPRPERAQFAERVLAGFTRVHVPAGASREVNVQIPARLLKYWSLTSGWTRARGKRSIYLAEHARDTRLTQQVDIR